MAEPTYQQAKALYDKLKEEAAALQQEVLVLRNALGQDHVNRFLLINDGLSLVVQQAEKGDLGARQQCELLLKNLERARAVVSGIALPANTAAAPKPGLVQ